MHAPISNVLHTNEDLKIALALLDGALALALNSGAPRDLVERYRRQAGAIRGNKSGTAGVR